MALSKVLKFSSMVWLWEKFLNFLRWYGFEKSSYFISFTSQQKIFEFALTFSRCHYVITFDYTIEYNDIEHNDIRRYKHYILKKRKNVQLKIQNWLKKVKRFLSIL